MKLKNIKKHLVKNDKSPGVINIILRHKML